jgi:hypothetical protein
VIESCPRINVAVLGSSALLAIVLSRDDGVAGDERFDSRAGGVVQLVIDAGEAVGVLRLAEIVLAQAD